MPNESEDFRLRRNLSYSTDSINQIFALTGCPHKFRGFIDVLLGFASGAEIVKVSDMSLISRMRRSPEEPDATVESRLKYVRRTFREWQEERGTQLVGIEKGYMDKDGNKHSSQYTLHILNLADQIIRESQVESENQNKVAGRYIEAAAKRVVGKFLEECKARPIKRRAETPVEKQIKNQLATAAGNLQKAIDLIEKNYTEISDEFDEQYLKLDMIMTELRTYLDPEEI